MFDSFDFDHSGTIDATELDSVMAHYRYARLSIRPVVFY
jgi:EF-hand domain